MTPPVDSDPKDTGDLLLAQGKLTEQQLEQARRRQNRLEIPQHRAIVDLNFASEEDAYRALAEVKSLDFIDLENLELDATLLQSIPLKPVLHYRVIPISFENGWLFLAVAEPLSLTDEGHLRLLLGKRLKQKIATPSSIHAVIKKHFGLGADTIQQLREGAPIQAGSAEVVFDLGTPEGNRNIEASISAFVDQVLLEALRLDATDIHLEPYPTNIRLRYRVDGLLQDIPVPTGLRPLHDSIISRIKVMAGLNIAERRAPHDGRIAMKTGKEEYALRVSIIPTKYGEALCLRILGRQSLFLDLPQLGMDPDQNEIMEALTRLPQGMVLITGPTGSGKTTTLYAALANANDSVRKIVTIENPVEYQLEGVSQIQTNDEIGLTFSAGLRAVLRHDPNVILIGEIRDVETAEIAIRAAQTGHLVFSTLHTNDSVSAITRLIEMKIEPFLIGSSLVCSIAQRLARRICRKCRKPDLRIPPRFREEMVTALNLAPAAVRGWQGTGCVECSNMGFRGRLALYEFFIMNDEIADLLGPGVKTSILRNAALKSGWKPLRHQGLAKVQCGLISISELQRISFRINEFLKNTPNLAGASPGITEPAPS